MLRPGWWTRRALLTACLRPMAALYCAVAGIRRSYWRPRALGAGAPVLVVGNLVAGGAGKTPLVIHLAQRALARGWRPGIVLRGYGGRARVWPQRVNRGSDPALVGDEAVLIARRTGCPVVAAPDRVAAAREVVADGCNLVISDDGLQHYRLARDREIVVIDAARGLGNGLCLPAGPLREPPRRLEEVDLIIASGGAWPQSDGQYQLVAGGLAAVGDACGPAPQPGTRVHGVAAIGDPARFFDTLRTRGFEVEAHPFPDHHRYTASDLRFRELRPVIMTEKDAVKCHHLPLPDLWYLPVRAEPDAAGAAGLDRLLDALAKEARES